MTDMQSRSTESADEAQAGRRHARRRDDNGWIGPGIGGAVLILMGLIFLAQNLGYPVPEKWWTIFLLIPALGAAVASWTAYRRDGKVNGEVAAALIGSVTLLVVAAALFFDLDWGMLWPLALVGVGAGILMRAYWR